MHVKKKLCIVHANCQADPLLDILGLAPEFARFWNTRLYVNYLGQNVPDAELEQCELFIYQHLDDKWGNIASKNLLARLGPKATAICLPNLFFRGYWPFWTDISPIDFGDSLLDKFIDAGADKAAIIKLYYHGNIAKYADFAHIAGLSLAQEHEKDARSPIKTAHILDEHWRDEMLFYTCNHPAKRLLVHVASELLRLLELTAPDARAIQEYVPEYANFELPIHPQVAEQLKLAFVAPEQTFNIFGRRLSFIQYLSRYIDCRQQGYADGFLGYLQLI